MTLDSPASALDRFHSVLVDEIRERRPENMTGPFTVAEIYQHLVPYASHRDRLGVDMNGDYEDVLLRLLAGEGDYLVVESDHARERMRSEVDSPHPDTTLYREFAAVDVRLNPDRVPDDDAPRDADGGENGRNDSAGGTGGDEEDHGGGAWGELAEAVSVDDLAPPPDRAPDEDRPVSPVEGHSEPSPEHAGQAGQGDESTTCSWCRETLPPRENLNFCPFCGTDVDVVPCRSCGEALEPGWLFCIGCGAGVSGE